MESRKKMVLVAMVVSLPSFLYFAKSSCISNLGGKTSSYLVLPHSSFKFLLSIFDSLNNC